MKKLLIVMAGLSILIPTHQTVEAAMHQDNQWLHCEKGPSIQNVSDEDAIHATTAKDNSSQLASVTSQHNNSSTEPSITEEVDQPPKNIENSAANNSRKLPVQLYSTADEVNERVLENEGILAGQAAAFLHAAELTNINVMYLISHATLETNHGTSPLASGVKVKVLKDKAGNEVEVFVLEETANNYDAIVYNMYGMDTNGSHPFLQGAKFAYFQGWTTPEKAIIGGAELISVNYVQSGRHKLYRKRDNPEAIKQLGYIPHQYTADSDWTRKQTNEIARLYGLLK